MLTTLNNLKLKTVLVVGPIENIMIVEWACVGAT